MTAMDTTETEQTFLLGRQWDGLYRDRYSYDRDGLMEEAIKAWRLNPLARRLTNLFKIYNLDGIEPTSDDPAAAKFLQEFWNNELNNMNETLEEISNEIFLTGNCFTIHSTDGSGMTYIRVMPTDQIAEIITTQNDLKQELSYVTKPLTLDAEPQVFYNPRNPANPSRAVYMTHHAINKLAGTSWGEGEIWPDLPWLSRYASWLEDRVRLNRYRSAFMYIVQGQFKSEADKQARQRQLNANPPRPGQVLVTDPSEQWGIMSAQLDSFDASVDGMAIKKMIAVNHVPMHMLAEPESSTRTTADAAGTPTYKAFENSQASFKRILESILQTVLTKRMQFDSRIPKTAKVKIKAADTTERDNAGLALATSQIVTALGDLFDRELIESDEYMRLVYRFAGEVQPAKAVPHGIRKPLNAKSAAPNAGGIKINTETGETRTKQK
jgi:hypothetical protein